MANLIKRIVRKLKSLNKKDEHKNGPLFCPVCSNNLAFFNPLPQVYADNAKIHGFKYFGQNEHLNIHQYSCPKCGSSDRDRFYASFFKNFALNDELKGTLLHVAPAWKLNDLFLKEHYQVTTTDLMMDGVDDQLNIEDLHAYEDNSFDYFICSHVLEHVDDPDKALSELYRVLKPDGRGIIMAPINPNISETIEDSTVTTKEGRIRHFGQEDHLRLFAKKDFMNRIEKVGFKLAMLGKSDFGEATFKKIGLRDSSILYIGIK